MLPPRDRLAPLALLFLGLTLAATAFAANYPRKGMQNVATGTKFFCGGVFGAPVWTQCDLPVRISTSKRIADGGTKDSRDGGEPSTPDTTNELITFPGDPYPFKLGPGESCFSVLSENADGGTNNCNFGMVTDP